MEMVQQQNPPEAASSLRPRDVNLTVRSDDNGVHVKLVHKPTALSAEATASTFDEAKRLAQEQLEGVVAFQRDEDGLYK